MQVVVTCTKRKKLAPAPGLSLREVTETHTAARCREWKHRLESATTSKVPARDLYAGDHWTVACALEELTVNGGEPVRVQVCSAAYGVVALTAPLNPYSATFSHPHPDSVCNSATNPSVASQRAEWWKELTSDQTISLTNLARQSPDKPLLLAVSAAYLDALQEDLASALEVLASPELLSVLSIGTHSLGQQSELLLGGDARLQARVGGVLRSLNVRLARELLIHSTDIDPIRPNLQKLLQHWMRETPRTVRVERESLTDQQVQEFILSQLAVTPSLRPTPLLTRLREGGQACEAKRFTRLYHQVREEFDAR